MGLSNSMATDHNCLKILSEHHHNLSKIEERQEDTKDTFEKMKKQIIHYQKIIQIFILSALALVSVFSLIIYIQKINLCKAHKILVEKNVALLKLKEHSFAKESEEYKHFTLHEEKQNKLLGKILHIMEDSSIICDSEFSLTKLAVLLQSNHVLVSQLVHQVFKKNFRLFLNEYRVKEAQKLFSEQGAAKYTIESVAHRVGFKSPNAFRHAFKNVTGVAPGFYFKSILEGKKFMQ